ncbi:hypothetical protein F5884DRAFT_744458 [Xylogone sp. PMI_703]|nr:hypothetical protein F5884DRAFT_744458 [Xylogone sp. PMI_703]
MEQHLKPQQPACQNVTPTSSLTSQSKKKKRTIMDTLFEVFQEYPDEPFCKMLQKRLFQSNFLTSLNLFNLCERDFDDAGERVIFDDIQRVPVPQYLTENLERIYAMTRSKFSKKNEAYSKMIIDQILISALHEENKASDPNTGYKPSYRRSKTPRTYWICSNPQPDSDLLKIWFDPGNLPRLNDNKVDGKAKSLEEINGLNGIGFVAPGDFRDSIETDRQSP